MQINRELFLGAALFGVGWGLVGLCPGPAVAGLGLNGSSGLLFFLAMGVGMFAVPSLRRAFQRTVPA